MRKTLIYLAVLAALGAGIYYLLPGDSTENPFDEAESGFTVKDTGAIGRIFIVANSGENILVERTDSGWTVDKRYKALPSMVDLLMSTFVKQVPLYPVTKSAYDNAVKTLSTHGLKVELYDRSGKKMKVFYVGGAAAGGSGTNMLMEGAKQPYVVETPGFVGYLTPRFSTRIRDWRDRTIFNVQPNDIQSITVQYPNEPQNSFTINRVSADSVAVMAKPEIMKLPAGLNTKRADAYLRFFGNINCEGFLNGLEDNEITIRTAPKHSSIELTTKSGDVQHVDIYWMAINKRSKNLKDSDIEDPTKGYDADRLYAVINDYRDTVLIQHLTFQNLFRRAKEFYSKDVPQEAPAQ